MLAHTTTTADAPRFALPAASEADAVHASGTSWSAIFAGAAAAAALSLILLILGVGLGLSAVSPWVNTGVGAASIGAASIVWLALTQILASGLGGYLAGRLRRRWAGVHTDEVYFRDTAHGFLAWAVASLVTAGLLAFATTSLVTNVAHVAGDATGAAAGAVASAANDRGNSDRTIGYYSASLLRAADPASTPVDAAGVADVNRILTHALTANGLNADDKRYLGALMAKRTGMTQADAEARVDGAYAQMAKTLSDAEAATRQKADDARRTAAHSALWMFVALLFGAFFASVSATLGGQQRDHDRVRAPKHLVA